MCQISGMPQKKQGKSRPLAALARLYIGRHKFHSKRQNGGKTINVCRFCAILFLSKTSENCGLQLVSKVPLDTFFALHVLQYHTVSCLFLVTLGHKVR